MSKKKFIFIKKNSFSAITAPNGLKWVTFTSSNEIVVQGESFTDAISYNFKYIKSDGTETIISSQQIFYVHQKMEKK